MTDPSAERPVPSRIQRQEGVRVAVSWRDGHESVYATRYLRGRCPCAWCVDEITGKRRVFEDALPAEVGYADLWLVGNYALGIRFTDGHDSGIYTFDYLRSICPCAACGGPHPGLGAPPGET